MNHTHSAGSAGSARLSNAVMYAGIEPGSIGISAEGAYINASEKTCGTGGTGVETSIIDSIRSRFSHSISDVKTVVSISQSERWRLMESSLDRIRASWNSTPPNWPAVDAINEKIGSTSDRNEFIRHLDEYERAFLAGGQPA